jgi:hypothetical protein
MTEEKYMLRLGTSNRELNLERRYRFYFFELTSMGKNLRMGKDISTLKKFVILCNKYAIFIQIRIKFNNYCSYYEKSNIIDNNFRKK